LFRVVVDQDGAVDAVAEIRREPVRIALSGDAGDDGAIGQPNLANGPVVAGKKRAVAVDGGGRVGGDEGLARLHLLAHASLEQDVLKHGHGDAGEQRDDDDDDQQLDESEGAGSGENGSPSRDGFHGRKRSGVHGRVPPPSPRVRN
jgi:hypothetical protein